jgi:glucose-1-phosphate thymidylyltransferase
MICCPEEIAYGMGYITAGQLRSLADQMADNAYALYLKRLADERM